MRIKSVREDGVIISTIRPSFMAWYGKYETALSIDGSSWRILEGYSTKEEAERGHNKYLNMSREELINLDYIS